MRFFPVLTTILALLAFSTAIHSAEKKADDGEFSASEVIEIDPVGPPAGFGKGKAHPGPRMFVWWTDGAWHVRSRTHKQTHVFGGKIHVTGGKVTKVFDFQGMEAGRKRDLGLLDEKRTTITFRFRTQGREDGFDFTVSPTAKSVQFALTLDGYPHPEIVAVGAKGKCATGAVFTLPAHPNEEPGQPEEQ